MNSSTSALLRTQGSMDFLSLARWLVYEVTFATAPVWVLGAQEVTVSDGRWAGVDIYHLYPGPAPSLLRLSANRTIQMLNMTFDSCQVRSQGSSFAWKLSAPRVSLRNITATGLTFSSALLVSIPQAAHLTMEDVSVSNSFFLYYGVHVEAVPGETLQASALLLSLTHCHLGGSALGAHFVALSGNYSLVEMNWTDVTVSTNTLQDLVGVGTNGTRADTLRITTKDITLDYCTIRSFMQDIPSTVLSFSGQNINCTTLYPRYAGYVALWDWGLATEGTRALSLESVKLSASRVSLVHAVDLELHVVDIAIQEVTCHTLVDVLRGNITFESAVASNNNFLYGLFAQDTHVEVNEVIVSSHSEGPFTAFFYFHSSEFVMNNTRFWDNQSPNASAVNFRYSTGTVTQSEWKNNTGFLGGGIYQLRGSLSLVNVTFIGNNAQQGGTVYVKNGNLSLDKAKISECEAGTGGAIYADSATVEVSNSLFQQCWSQGAGGFIAGLYSSIHVNNSAWKRASSQLGGGLNLYKGQFTAKRLVISGTSAKGSGGAFHLEYAHFQLDACRIVDSSAIGSGGDINAFGSDINIHNTTFSDSGSREGASMNLDKCIYSISHSLFNRTHGKQWGTIYSHESRGNLSATTFVECTADFAGGALVANISTINLQQCNFTQGTAMYGGAVLALEGSINIKETLFDTNKAQEGGALYLTFTTLALDHVTFQQCSAAWKGGSVQASRLSMRGQHVQVLHSHASGGGGFLLQNTSVEMENLSFSHCSAYLGGAMVLQGSSQATLHALNISYCVADSLSGGEGAGIYMDSVSQLQVTQGCFQNNRATRGAALLLLESAFVSLEDTELRDNNATRGGAIFLRSQVQLWISGNSVLRGNQATQDGGALVGEGQAQIVVEDGLFYDNQATSSQGYGGALSLRQQVSFTANHTIFQGNNAVSGGAMATATETESDEMVHVEWYNTSCIDNHARYGGALYLSSASFTFLVECNCTSNSALAAGGCVYTSGVSSVTLQQSTAEYNWAPAGGAYWIGGSSHWKDEDSTIRYNRASRGAGVYMEGGSNQMDSVYLYSNVASSSGGGLFVNNYVIEFIARDCLWHANYGQQGGAIALEGIAVWGSNQSLISNSIFLNNEAEEGGGVYISDLQERMPVFGDCQWIKNNASRFGGAVFINTYSTWPVLMTNNTFQNNWAFYGGCNLACGVLETLDAPSVNETYPDCSWGSSPNSYQGYQNAQQWASLPSQMTVQGCSQPVPLDKPYLDLNVILKDGFGTQVSGHYLQVQNYTIELAVPPGATSSSSSTQNVTTAGEVTFTVSMCGLNHQAFPFGFIALVTGRNPVYATCEAELSGCSKKHYSVRHGDECDKCGLDALIILLILALALFTVAVILVVCCVLVRVITRSVKRHRLRSMNIPDVFADNLSIEELLTDHTIPKLPWEEIEFQTVLGKGASGLVRKAVWTHGSSRRLVATKELFLTMEDPESTFEFCKEVKYLSALHHPNVVQFVGILAAPDRTSLHLVTELMERGSLHDIIFKKGANIPLSLRFKIAIDAATGIRFIHSKKLIHRDLKTHNLLVNELWDTKVADFGISTMNPTVTRQMTCIGTPVYMAPEVLQKEAYSSRADVYSFAVVLAELFTNQMPYTQPPYETMNSAQLVYYITEKSARPSLQGLHPTLQALIEECWASQPHSRPSFHEIIVRLKRLQSDLTDPSGLEMASLLPTVSREDDEEAED